MNNFEKDRRQVLLSEDFVKLELNNNRFVIEFIFPITLPSLSHLFGLESHFLVGGKEVRTS